MELSQPIALGVFTSYFFIIIALFTLIIKSLPTSHPSSNGLKIWGFRALTLASLAHTWFYMFKFMAWSFEDFENTSRVMNGHTLQRITSWLIGTSLFEQAWAAVCFGSINWWWSEQLCIYTVIWTIFLATEARTHRVKHIWVYMLLGQLVAISVASNLLYLALVLSQSPGKTHPSKKTLGSNSTYAYPSLYIPILISVITIALTPYTNELTFLPNLLLMHFLLVIPLVSRSPSGARSGGSSIRMSTFITTIRYLILAVRIRTDAVAIAALFTSQGGLSVKGAVAAAWKTLHSHPAQSSIGWDVVWTSISLVSWIISSDNMPEVFGTLVGLPGIAMQLGRSSVKK